MRLIIGLGNPGKAYSQTRHNVGFRCLDIFAIEHNIFFKRRELAQIGRGKVASKDVILAKPRTFINLSGEVVAPLVRKFGISLSDLLIIYDDLDLPLGKIRIRERGSAGGHNGMKSIISHLGSQDFPRIRVGIAPQEENISPSSFKTPEFVLSEFTAEEKPVVDKACVWASEAIFFILSEGIIMAMNKFN